ncbi:ATP-binding cassette domain-containing protein [Actinoplanes subtropicus]|uniref:ATP-binding cassette domain-containing protein n=1 Tax=Actinoplanes subtropicus TaxID=543632 RepID=UPI000AFCD8BF|nr:ABC transporter ATP-binding protein [Actinoplanes subtropicus]
MTALIGRNAAGKTTLLHLAVGLTAASSGRVEVLGRPPAAVLPEVGFVAQDAPLYTGLRVAEIVRLTGRLNRRWDAAAAYRRLREREIPLDRRVGRLSGGQQAQLALALALAKRPRLLVLDEPLARLDPLARHDFLGMLMSAVAEEGMSVIFSSHVVAEIERVCDDLVVLSAGHVQVAGAVDDLLAEHQLLSGPTGEAVEVADRLQVVARYAAPAQTRLLVRRRGREVAPPRGWQAQPVGLEELVLTYLRAPAAAALPGPHRLGAGASAASR